MMPTKPHSITLLYLLAQAGDLHPNPGQNSSITQTPPQNYSCGSCRQEVHDQDHAMQCDECDHWYHTACVQMNDTSYEQLKFHSVLWFCSCCGLPNCSNCLFSSNISTSNPYSVLDTPADSRDYPNMSEEPSTTFAQIQQIPLPLKEKMWKPNLNWGPCWSTATVSKATTKYLNCKQQYTQQIQR